MKNLVELQNLKGKIALITGGAGYLGTAICETLCELGADVIIASRDKNKCVDLANKLEIKYKVTAFGIETDIVSESSLTNTFNLIEKEFGKLDILINNAWSGKKNSFDSITSEDWIYDINVCLNGPFYTTKILLPLIEKSKGVILNVASMYGHLAPDYKIYQNTEHTNPPSYGAAKAGIIQFTKYLASFLATKEIRVNSISPGPFPYGKILENKSFIDKLNEKNIIGRIGEPEDLKGVIALLCTDASKYITGQNICVDGGWGVW